MKNGKKENFAWLNDLLHGANLKGNDDKASWLGERQYTKEKPQSSIAPKSTIKRSKI